jgi:hypothetical protein
VRHARRPHLTRRRRLDPRASSSSRASVSEESFGTIASARQRERCLESDPLVRTIWPRMAGAVGRVMNVERVRRFLGVRAFRGAGGQRDPVLGCRERPASPAAARHARRPRPRHIRVYADQLVRHADRCGRVVKALERLDMVDVAFSSADEPRRAALSRKGDTRSFTRRGSRSRLRQTVSPPAACGRTVRVV